MCETKIFLIKELISIKQMGYLMYKHTLTLSIVQNLRSSTILTHHPTKIFTSRSLPPKHFASPSLPPKTNGPLRAAAARPPIQHTNNMHKKTHMNHERRPLTYRPPTPPLWYPLSKLYPKTISTIYNAHALQSSSLR